MRCGDGRKWRWGGVAGCYRHAIQVGGWQCSKGRLADVGRSDEILRLRGDGELRGLAEIGARSSIFIDNSPREQIANPLAVAGPEGAKGVVEARVLGEKDDHMLDRGRRVNPVGDLVRIGSTGICREGTERCGRSAGQQSDLSAAKRVFTLMHSRSPQSELGGETIHAS